MPFLSITPLSLNENPTFVSHNIRISSALECALVLELQTQTLGKTSDYLESNICVQLFLPPACFPAWQVGSLPCGWVSINNAVRLTGDIVRMALSLSILVNLHYLYIQQSTGSWSETLPARTPQDFEFSFDVNKGTDAETSSAIHAAVQGERRPAGSQACLGHSPFPHPRLLPPSCVAAMM